MIELVTADQNGVRLVDYTCLYILIQEKYSFQLGENSGTIVTKKLLFTNTDISNQGRTDLVNFVMNWIENNPID